MSQDFLDIQYKATLTKKTTSAKRMQIACICVHQSAASKGKELIGNRDLRNLD